MSCARAVQRLLQQRPAVQRSVGGGIAPTNAGRGQPRLLLLHFRCAEIQQEDPTALALAKWAAAALWTGQEISCQGKHVGFSHQ